MSKQLPTTGDEPTPWDVINRARMGYMRSTGEIITMLLLLEDNRDGVCDVLNQVCNALGISGRELDHFREMPDVVFEEQRRKWEAELERMRHEQNQPKERSDGSRSA